MNFYIIVLSICLFVSLFLIYTLSKEDFILLRKDISMDKLFNFIFLIFIVGLFSSRVIYAIIYSPRMFLNPLLFLLFPYFPGLSLLGGVVGIGAYIRTGIFIKFASWIPWILFIIRRKKSFSNNYWANLYSIKFHFFKIFS